MANSTDVMHHVETKEVLMDVHRQNVHVINKYVDVWAHTVISKMLETLCHNAYTSISNYVYMEFFLLFLRIGMQHADKFLLDKASNLGLV